MDFYCIVQKVSISDNNIIKYHTNFIFILYLISYSDLYLISPKILLYD